MDPITSLDDALEGEEREPHAGRILGLKLVVVLTFAVLVAQLWHLQIVQGNEYRERADNNRFRLMRIEAPRGVMYDRNGVLLVRNSPSYTIAIIPADLPKDPSLVYRHLGILLNMSPEQIRKMVELPPFGERSTDAFTSVPIKTNVSTEIAFAIEERHLELAGVHVEVQPIREYLDGPLTSHILGYVGRITKEQYEELKDDPERKYALNDLIGQTGLEYTYEAELRGRVGERQMEVDFSGRPVYIFNEKPPKAGYNLRLTIDLALQREINNILAQNIEQYGSAAAIAMDPRNGQILAMADLPTYDNNLFSRGISAEAYKDLLSQPGRPLVNHSISDAYPPGSVFKIVTASAALQDKVVSIWTRITCNGYILVPNRYAPNDPRLAAKFSCWGIHGPQDLISGLADSCDVYFYHLGGGPPNGEWDGLGVKRLGDYAKIFGLGDYTGIDLPGEVAGNIPTEGWKLKFWGEPWYKGDTYNMAIGQGFVTVTPLQMLNAAAAIANGGTLYKPQLVLEVTDADGRVIRSFHPQPIRQLPLREEYINAVKEGMRANMLVGTTPGGTKYAGTAYTANVPEIKMAGKTGTAEYGTPNAKGEMPTHGWFVAYAPLENPEIAVLVFVEHGKGTHDAAELVKKIMRYYFRLPEIKETKAAR
ncbi:MAG: penicillin-binding protein 2 [Chloroflexi bacterium]|nr:penicillin-binding protein 2 [Chloroflexota bacterium]MCL5075329.1 penicillin-binding protein 2 [Chloroflexota bacterium]